MSTIKFRYSASSNISFKGTVDSGIEAEDWADLSDRDQDSILSEALRRLVDIDVID